MASNDIIETISKYTGIATDGIKQKIRNKAIANAMEKLASAGKSPFDVGEEEFEVFVNDEEIKIQNKLTKWAGLGGVAIALMLSMLGIEES